MLHFIAFAMIICYYCFCSHIQSFVELESEIAATAPYFEHTASLTYSLWTLTKRNIFLCGYTNIHGNLVVWQTYQHFTYACTTNVDM